MSLFISQNLYLAAASGSALPLTHARIGYHSYLDETNTTTIFNGDAGHPIGNILTTQTFETYKTATFPASIIDIDLGTAQDVDYVGLVGKSLISFNLKYSNDGITYTEILALSDASKVAKLGLFELTTARYWQLTVGGANGSLDIANVKLGLSLAMYRPIYGGHTPLSLSRSTVSKPNISEGGEFLGSTIIRKGFNTSYDFQHLPASWYRSVFDPFVEHAIGGTFYVAWRPSTYPLEVGYCLSNSDISPSNMGIRDLMQVTFNVVGYDAS